MLAENVNKRLTKAMDELKEKHATGTNEIDDPDRAPTGAPYRQIEQQQQQAHLAKKQQQEKDLMEAQRDEQQRETWRHHVHQKEQDGLDDVDSDDEYDDLLDEDNDPVLEALRQKRLLELKRVQAKHAENIAKGHGQYRTISQDELLPECTGSSEWVAIHFFHREFQRCQIMDHHLKQVASQHITCKFLRIDAEKAPFLYVSAIVAIVAIVLYCIVLSGQFVCCKVQRSPYHPFCFHVGSVSKLSIRTLPTLIVFREGKAINRLTGFEGLASAADADNFPTSKLKAWLAETGCIDYGITKDELVREELLEERRAGRHGAIWSTAQQLDDLDLY